MEWAVMEEAAVAQLFREQTLLEKKEGYPSIGAVLLTYFHEYQTSDFKITRARSSALLDSIQSENAHFYLIFAVTLSWLSLEHMSFYHVLFCVPLVTITLFIFINYLAFLFLENDIKWIAKEARLLSAIAKDADGIKALREQITSKAKEVWKSELESGVVTLGLNESELAWVDKITTVASKANDIVNDFKNRRERKIIPRKISFSMLDYTEVDALLKRIKEVEDDIDGSILTKKVHKIDVCESLEKSRTAIRKLLDRPIEEEQENKWVKSRLQVGHGGFLSSLVEKVGGLINQIKGSGGGRDRFPLNLEGIELQLMVLYPFLQHVEGLQLESEIGKAWLKEVDEIVDKAKFVIDAFYKATAYQAWWLEVPRIVKTWKARRKLEAGVKRIDLGFSVLFQRKERYGFKFIIRDSSKSSKYHNGDGRERVLHVVKKIREFLDDQAHHQLGWVSDKLKLLCDELENMCKLLDDAEATHAGINSLGKASLEEMEKVANIAAKSMKDLWNKSASVYGSYNWLRSARARVRLWRGIDQIKNRIHVIERSIRAYSIELIEDLSSTVGLEEDVDALVRKLTAESSDKDCSFDVFSIVGMEGIGKTTLAKKVYGHSIIIDSFPIRVWVNVPKNGNGNELSFPEDVGRQIICQSGLSLQEKEINPEEEEEYWKTVVSDLLGGDRYLLVLDNVSTKEAMDKLVRLMVLKASKGCRVLLTTRDEEVASLADHHSSRKLRHRIRLRTEDESLSLLKQMVYISSGEETIAEDIVSGCLGLPLSIVRIGCIMMLKQGVTFSKALEKVPLLKSSFNETDKELPPHLKPLLEHFDLFPMDFEIPARRLITLWVSEGLVQKSGEKNQTLEQVAEEHLSELIDRAIVQVVKRKASGRVKTCCLPVKTQPTILQFSRETPQNIIKSVQRLAHHFDNKDHSSSCLIHSSSTRPEVYRVKLRGNDLEDDRISLDYRNLSSFISFDPREGNEPGEKIGNFLRRGIARGYFRGLYVLDLERVFRPELPNNMRKLKKLRYLGLRWTYLQNIPSSIGELVHLETLDLKHTYVHTLPSSVWKLQKLRHLYLNQSSRSKFMRPPGGSFLKSLETLWGVFVDTNSPLMDCLDKMTNLRKLGLVFQLDAAKQRTLADRIMKLKCLQHLGLRSINESSKPGDLYLKLSGLENLSSLDLFGELENPLNLDEFPKQLTELTLSASGLSNDSMSKLGKLLNLKFLCLYSNSYRGISMAFSDGDFPQLLVLKLWKLEELEGLAFHENSLRKIQELEIRSCRKLKVPDQLKNLKTLLELKLTTMPEDFLKDINNIKGQIWSDTSHSPSIKIIHYL